MFLSRIYHFSRQRISRIQGQIIRNLFIRTEQTPNPDCIKFSPGGVVLQPQFGDYMTFDKSSPKSSRKSPLVLDLFEIPGVISVFFSKDFLTITKASDADWQETRPRVFTCLLDFFGQDNRPLVFPEASSSSSSSSSSVQEDSEVVSLIKELIETKIRPSVQEDGGDIFFVRFVELTGVVQVRLAGSCSGCPSSSVTLRNGVENMLMHYITEVKGIEDVSDSEMKEIMDHVDDDVKKNDDDDVKGKKRMKHKIIAHVQLKKMMMKKPDDDDEKHDEDDDAYDSLIDRNDACRKQMMDQVTESDDVDIEHIKNIKIP